MSEYMSKEEINRVLLNRIDMNNKCLSGARESKHFEEEKYFSTLIFEDEQIASLIEELPSTDVRPNIHGHWIRHLRNDLGVKLNDCIECSACKTWFTTEELLRRSFCPNCGADMREPKCETCKNCNKAIGCSKHIACQRENMKFYEPKGEKGTE